MSDENQFSLVDELREFFVARGGNMSLRHAQLVMEEVVRGEMTRENFALHMPSDEPDGVNRLFDRIRSTVGGQGPAPAHDVRENTVSEGVHDEGNNNTRETGVPGEIHSQEGSDVRSSLSGSPRRQETLRPRAEQDVSHEPDAEEAADTVEAAGAALAVGAE